MGSGQRGAKGKTWDNCSSTIDKISLKKQKNKGEKSIPSGRTSGTAQLVVGSQQCTQWEGQEGPWTGNTEARRVGEYSQGHAATTEAGLNLGALDTRVLSFCSAEWQACRAAAGVSDWGGGCRSVCQAKALGST